MFGFINSFLLPFLLTAAIPILIHFFNKQKSKKIIFSSVRFLKQIEAERIKKVKLYQLLLILARTLFILFLVMAFTRPVYRSYVADLNLNAPSTAVIILDDSYSMQTITTTQSYFDIAKKRLKDILFSLNNNDNIFLITSFFNAGKQIEKTFSEFSSLQVQNKTFDIASALAASDTLFSKHKNLNKEIFIISDFKFNESDFKKIEFKNSENLNIFEVNVSQNETFRNISIDSVAITNQLLEVNKPISANVFLKNHSQEVKETSLNLFNNGKRIASNYIKLDPLQKSYIQVNFTIASSGNSNLLFEISEDDLSIDNSFYLSLYIPEKINVLLLSNNNQLALDAAIEAINQDSLVRINVKKYAQLQSMDLKQFQVIVLENPEILNEYQLNLFENNQSDASIIFIPGQSYNLINYNNWLERLCGRPIFTNLIEAGPQGFFTLQTEITGNDLFESLFFSTSGTFSSPQFNLYLKQNRPEKTMIRFKNGDSYLTKYSFNDKRPVYVFSSAFNEKWSDISLRGLFVPLLSRLFFEAAASGNLVDKKYYKLDQSINISLNNFSKNSVVIETAAKEQYSGLVSRQGNYAYLNLNNLQEPGVLKLLDNNTVIKSISVNPPSDELKGPFIKNFPFEIISLDSQNNLSLNLKNYRDGTELWYIFVILSILMIAFEIFLIKLIEGKVFLPKRV